MTRLLLRLFLKISGSSCPMPKRFAVGKLAGAVGVICNVLLFFGKLAAGLLTHSVSLIADGVNNLSDAAASVITFLGFRMAQLPADREHPFGHARYEYLSGFAAALLIFALGVELIQSSIDKIFHPLPVVLSPLPILLLTLSVALKIWLSRFYKSLSVLIDSLSLRAASLDSRNDVIASLAVLSGYLISHIFSISLDGYLGLAVAFLILYSAFSIAKEAVSPLLGKKADKALTEKITQTILSSKEVLGVHDLLFHDYGPGHCYASVHAEISANESPVKIHDVLDRIEKDVLEQFNIHLVIHCDPVLPPQEERRR